MLKSIFISSTFVDLKEIRSGIWNTLSNFEVNILGMEAFGASPEKPLDRCLKEVEKCDYFVLIISYLYGSVDPKTGKSFTELEYEKAVESGKKIYAFIIHNNDAEIKTKYIENSPNFVKLLDFKKKIADNHTVYFYKNYSLLQKAFIELLSKIKLKQYQPQRFTCKLIRKTIYNQKWVIFIGYHHSQPISIFPVQDDDELLIPVSLNEGIINKERVYARFRHDFEYTNKKGYRTTVEGIDYGIDEDSSISVIINAINSILILGYPNFEISHIVENLYEHSKMSTRDKGIINAIIQELD